MLKPLVKIVLVPLRLTAAAVATYAAIHQKMFGSGTRPHMLVSRPPDLASRTSWRNEERNDIENS